MTTIHVKYAGNTELQPITVRGGYWDGKNFIEDWCNHAGAVRRKTIHVSWDIHTEDTEEYTDYVILCDKCQEVIESDYDD